MTFQTEPQRPNYTDAIEGNPDPFWRSGAERALAQLAGAGRPFVLSDLREEPYCLPDPHHPNAWGSLMRWASRAGLVVPIGFRQSDVPSRHGSVVRIWQAPHRPGDPV